MAQRSVGIEIGTKAVRVVTLNGGGRVPVAEQYIEEPIVSQSGGLDGVEAVLKLLAAQHLLQGEAIAVSLPAGQTLTARLTLPFDDPRVIEQVMGAQLSGKLPIGPEHVISFSVIGPSTDPDEKGFDVLVAGYPRNVVAARLESLRHVGCDPQFAVSLELAEHRAARMLYPNAVGIWGLMDIGARSTRLTIMDGTRYVSSRSLLVGGAAISEAIGEDLAMSDDTAERVKLAYGFAAPANSELAWHQQLAEKGSFDGDDPPDPVALAKAIRMGMRPMLMALRQSLAAVASQCGAPLERLVLAGGGARLRAVAPYLTQVLGIDCQPVRLEAAEIAAIAPNPLAQPEMVGPLALALVAAGEYDGGIDINFRRGDLAFKGSMEFLKERIVSLTILLVLLVGGLIFMLSMRHHALTVEREQLRANLAEASSALFGSEALDINSIRTQVEGAKGYSFMPERSAFDHFAWISNALSMQLADVDFELEMVEIDVLRKVVTIKGDTENDLGVPRLTSVLSQYDCFPDSIPEPQTQKARGRVSFTLRIDANHCYGATEGE